jgi:hypothetical protein
VAACTLHTLWPHSLCACCPQRLRHAKKRVCMHTSRGQRLGWKLQLGDQAPVEPAAPRHDAHPQVQRGARDRLLSFLREEAERERLEEIERLKPIGTQLGPYTAYRCGIWEPGDAGV